MNIGTAFSRNSYVLPTPGSREGKAKMKGNAVLAAEIAAERAKVKFALTAMEMYRGEMEDMYLRLAISHGLRVQRLEAIMGS